MTETTGFADYRSVTIAGKYVRTEAMPPGTDLNWSYAAGYSPDPVNTANGSFAYRRTDVAIAGRGPTPTFTRTYNSNDTRVGPLRPGRPSTPWRRGATRRCWSSGSAVRIDGA